MLLQGVYLMDTYSLKDLGSLGRGTPQLGGCRPGLCGLAPEIVVDEFLGHSLAGRAQRDLVT